MAPVPKITRQQMTRWRRLEAEHSPSPKRQETIVRQHVGEHGIHYYPALIKMETTLQKKYPQRSGKK
jgi:hypothetical protein